MKKLSVKSGFTIVELLVVIVVLGVLASVTVVAYNGVQKRARDSQRLAALSAIVKGVELYRTTNGSFPPVLCTGLGCQEGWESSANEAAGQFLTPLGNNGGYGFSSTVPVDPINNGAHTSYDTVIATEGLYEFVYYVYPAGSNGCDVNKGQYYIVGAVRTEMTNRNPIQGSPGFQCGTRDWKYEMAWVSGAFAN